MRHFLIPFSLLMEKLDCLESEKVSDWNIFKQQVATTILWYPSRKNMEWVNDILPSWDWTTFFDETRTKKSLFYEPVDKIPKWWISILPISNHIWLFISFSEIHRGSSWSGRCPSEPEMPPCCDCSTSTSPQSRCLQKYNVNVTSGFLF